MVIDLSGRWMADLGDGVKRIITIPGTLDESGIGYKDAGKNAWHPASELGNAVEHVDVNAPIATRFTRKHTFEGKAVFKTECCIDVPSGKRVFFEVERARSLRLFIDGVEVSHYQKQTLSTPHIFEVTEVLKGIDNLHRHQIQVISDNSYERLPARSIKDSSAATDETQTNWNGLLGYVRFRIEDDVFLSRTRIYHESGKIQAVSIEKCAEDQLRGADSISIELLISAARAWHGSIYLSSQALKESVCIEKELQAGDTKLWIEGIELREQVQFWDEAAGMLYELQIMLQEKLDQADASITCVVFGVRDFTEDGQGHLALNSRRIFLRGEANCAVFPETGHVPMTIEEWMEILLRYQEYGVNCMRFHSYCPPDAAYVAADRIGMLMQPELSNWNPKDAFATQECMEYYKDELEQILYTYANHPSFVMLTLGNELHADEAGHKRMEELIERAHAIDATRLIADGSNVHYGEIGCDVKSDFYASQKFYEKELRGTYSGMQGYINSQYPNAKTNYDETMKAIRKEYAKPVFTFEVGQFEVLPDFDEIYEFKGISSPVNLQIIKDRAREKGFLPIWKKCVEATGELARIGYREEIEAALRTKDLSGISLLGLQDFPGQGTALVGMMNAHLQAKPFDFAAPEQFQKFFCGQRVLVLLEKYTYVNTEYLEAEVVVANYGRDEIRGRLMWSLKCAGCSDEVKESNRGAAGSLDSAENSLETGSEDKEVNCTVGELTRVGKVRILLSEISQAAECACRFDLTVSVGNIQNTYPIWVYPDERSEPCPANVYEAAYFDEKAEEVLKKGGVVYLAPKSIKEALPHSIKAQFTTDFWSVGTFADQEGGMGQLIDTAHPIFREFPTEMHTNWQWWAMATQRAAILPDMYSSIITELDSYAFLRPMTQLLECRCLNGTVLFSTLGLKEQQKYPECRALQRCIYRYLDAGQFSDSLQRIEPEVFKDLVKKVEE